MCVSEDPSLFATLNERNAPTEHMIWVQTVACRVMLRVLATAFLKLIEAILRGGL